MEKQVVTILLIEDDDVDAMAIQRSFHKNRIANPIVRAYDGLEALQLLKNNDVPKPYIILLDLNMPRMGGLEFLGEIRNDQDLKSSVVFILTTSSDDRDITSSYEKFVAGYFIKEETGVEFENITDMLSGYWKIVHLPKEQ